MSNILAILTIINSIVNIILMVVLIVVFVKFKNILNVITESVNRIKKITDNLKKTEELIVLRAKDLADLLKNLGNSLKGVKEGVKTGIISLFQGIKNRF